MSYKTNGKGGLTKHDGGPVRCGESVFSESLFSELVETQTDESGAKDVKMAKEAVLLKKLKVTSDKRSLNIKRGKT